MRVVDTATGLPIKLRRKVERPSGDFTVLSVQVLPNRRASRLTLVAGDHERIRHVVLPVYGHLWWKWVEYP